MRTRPPINRQTGGSTHLRRPSWSELDAIGELCLRSKALWGYDAAFLEQCRSVLQIDEACLKDDLARVAEAEGGIVGVVQISMDGVEAELDLLFVEPEALGRGVGALLFAWAARTAAERGADRLVILSDPGARCFYERQGARFVCDAPSDAIEGRTLPLLEVRLGSR